MLAKVLQSVRSAGKLWHQVTRKLNCDVLNKFKQRLLIYIFQLANQVTRFLYEFRLWFLNQILVNLLVVLIKLLELSLNCAFITSKCCQLRFQLVVQFSLNFVCEVVYFFASFVFCFLDFFYSALCFLKRRIKVLNSSSKFRSFLANQLNMSIIDVLQSFDLMISMLAINNSTVRANRFSASHAVIGKLGFVFRTKFIFFTISFLQTVKNTEDFI